MSNFDISVQIVERLLPESIPETTRVVPLSLLDATTANFGLTNALWLFEPPSAGTSNPKFDLAHHLRKSLCVTLDAYPQWCGQLRAVSTRDGSVGEEAKGLPPHARRFGRIYAYFGTSDDPGVEFIVAKSSAALGDLYPASRTSAVPVWDRQKVSLKKFIPPTEIASALQPNEPSPEGLRKPLMAVQLTELACGSIILAAKSTHPLADITALVRFINDWAKLSRASISNSPKPLLNPVFEPSKIDALAAGNIDEDGPDPEINQRAESLPFHRFDWWAPVSDAPWPVEVPEVFQNEVLQPAGRAMPWSEWDVSAHVSDYTIHLNRHQVDYVYKRASANNSKTRISRHDAILAHIWSCIARARNQQDEDKSVHCDLVYGLRPIFNLGESFLGSPIVMINVELPGNIVAKKAESSEEGTPLAAVAQQVRKTINGIAQTEGLAAHLHSLGYEKSPQRIWQAFLGQRHILVTTWARAGLYDIDFGLGRRIRFADGIVPDMDGNVLIKEGPPVGNSNNANDSWTDNGVDISVHICDEDMGRLIKDPRLLPQC